MDCKERKGHWFPNPEETSTRTSLTNGGVFRSRRRSWRSQAMDLLLFTARFGSISFWSRTSFTTAVSAVAHSWPRGECEEYVNRGGVERQISPCLIRSAGSHVVNHEGTFVSLVYLPVGLLPILALAGVTTAFVLPGPSVVVSGPTQLALRSTSQVRQ